MEPHIVISASGPWYTFLYNLGFLAGFILLVAEGYRRNYPSIIPIMVADISEVSVPAISAGTPYFDNNTLLFGASDPIPPICIPMEATLANPQSR